MPDEGLGRALNDPILLPNGRQLLTLHDPANYITKLPKRERHAPEWRTAIEVLMLVAEHGGPTMMARIGAIPALHRHDDAPPPTPTNARTGRAPSRFSRRRHGGLDEVQSVSRFPQNSSGVSAPQR
jgi:hypothetical protein